MIKHTKSVIYHVLIFITIISTSTNFSLLKSNSTKDIPNNLTNDFIYNTITDQLENIYKDNPIGTPAGWPRIPLIILNNDPTTGIYNLTGSEISITTNATERLNIDTSGNVSIKQFGTGPGLVHNDASGNLTNSLLTNSDITPLTITSASIANNTITNTQIATGAAISDTKLDTISTTGKVANSATTATNSNIADKIVLRDSSGNFNAGTITASLSGNVTGNLTGDVTGNADTATTAVSFSGPVGGDGGDITGLQGNLTVITVGGLNATGISAGANLANAATSDNTYNTIVKRSAAGNFTASTITANLIGNITGACFGNADTATYATTAGSTPILSGSFGASGGDITGTQNSLTVNTVGGKTFTQISQTTDLVLSATSNNVADTIVKRDSSGNFIANMITLNTGAIINPTDVTTKSYVDSVATGGLVPKTPALVVNSTDTALSGLQTIDSITLIDNDRVLLVEQTNQIQNGLWLAHTDTWTRPTDFATNDAAQGAYVLINSGAINAGTSWLCSTPAAIIGTDNIQFTQFSLPDQTTAANVGSGTGQIFRDKNGVTLNLKTLAALSHISITNNSNDISIGTNATDANTANTIIARDASGYFTASGMTGAASANVLKTGDTMTGNLNLNTNSGTRSEIKLQDATGLGYVGLRGPSALASSSYTIDLPDTAPVANQFLQATSSSAPFTTQWATVGSPLPSAAKTYYVSLAGNDSNDGSFSAPFRTVKYAVTQANNLPASITNPIVINVGAGIFSEDNSGGGIQITVDGINIVGSSLASTIIVPQQVTSDDLFVVTKPNTEFYNLILKVVSGTSTKSAIKFTTTTGGTARFNSVGVSSFYNAFEINCSSTLPLLLFDNIQLTDNTTGLLITNGNAVIKSSTFQGSSTNTPLNTFLSSTGANSQIDIIGCGLKYFDTCLNTTAGTIRISSTNIENSKNGIICQNACKCYITSLNSILNHTDSVNVSAQDSGTIVYVEGCMFDCKGALSEVATGTAIRCTNAATINLSSTTIENAAVGLEINGTITTAINANGLNLIHCPIDILQRGTSSLSFVGGTVENSVVDFEDPTNISLAAFNSNGETTLSFGNTTDSQQMIYNLQNGQPILPNLIYEPNYYGNKGAVYKNSNTGVNATPTFNAVQADYSDASFYAITGQNDKEAKIKLISDTANIGTEDNIRGWEISKLGNTGADLAFTYTNNDPGIADRGPNTIMRLNGLDNQIEFPSATNTPLPANTEAKLVWAPDVDAATNLYRNTADSLKTDANFTVGSALSISSGFAPDTPSLCFADEPTTGIYKISEGKIGISTLSNERLTIDGSGNISISQFGTTGGVVHNDASGNLTNSLIVNADIDAAAAIADTKLATISTAGKVSNSATTATNLNTTSAIVARDASGNFSAGTITFASGAKLPIGGSSTKDYPSICWGTGTGFYSLIQGYVHVTTSGTYMAEFRPGTFETLTGTTLLSSGPLTVSGAATFATGTAASPSIQFSGSATNTGIYTSAANKINIGVSGLNLITFEYPTVSIPSNVAFVANGDSTFKKPVVFDGSVAFNGKVNILASSYNSDPYSIPANVNVIALTGSSSNFYVSTRDPYEMQMGKIVTFIAAGPGDYTIRSRNDSTEGSIILNPISLLYGHAVQFIYAGTLGTYPYALVKLNG